MSAKSRSEPTFQDMIDADWFIDSSPPMPDPVKAFKDEMKYMRDNPFEARWITTKSGKRWLFINAEPQDWTMY